MTTTLVTLTGDVSDAIGTDFDPRRTKVYVRHNTDKVVTDSGPIHLGGGTVNVESDGTFTLPNIVAATSLVENLQATVYVDYADPATRQRATATFGPYDLSAETGTVDIRDLEEVQALPASAISQAVATLQGYVAQGETVRDETQAIRDGIVGDLGTTDSQTATLVNGPSLTSAALTASFARVVTPQKFGAVGNGTADDTEALQDALDAAIAGGALLYIPKGIYKVTAPITATFVAATQRFQGIAGDGYQSIIVGHDIASGRAAVELLGSSNVDSVMATLRDFRVVMSVSSSAGSYCLRLGDAKNCVTVDRVTLDGANCLSLRVASSASYAQINTTFRNCTFTTNHNWDGTWADDAHDSSNDAAFYALSCLGDDWGGALWDNVRFETCTFIGLVSTKAFDVTFDTCQFSTNPNRPTVGGIDYANNVLIAVGGTHAFRSCYFEDHKYGIVVAPGIGDIGTVSVESSRFSGIDNYGGASERAQAGVMYADLGNGNSIGYVRVVACEFGDDPTDGYELGAVVNNGGTNGILSIEGCKNWQNPATSIRVPGLHSNRPRLNHRSVFITADNLYGDDDIVYVDTFNGAMTLYPAPNNCTPHRIYTVKDVGGGLATKPITIQPTSGTIDGAASKTFNTPYAAIRYVFDGTNFWTI